MILDPDAYISDAGFFPDQPTDERTDEQGDSRSWISKKIYFFAHSFHSGGWHQNQDG